MKKIICLMLSMIILSTVSYSQTDEASKEPLFYLGGFGHYNFNFHNADFKMLPGYYSCCPTYQTGSGSGWDVGALFEYPINPTMNVGLRVGYSVLNADLITEETIGNALEAGITPPVTKVRVEHKIESDLALFTFEPYFFYNFYDKFYTTLGLKAGFLSTAKFSQNEKILSPDNVVFAAENSIIRNKYSNKDIPDKNSLLLFGAIGLGYEFSYLKTGTIAPEIRYELPFTNVSSVNWKPSVFNVGLVLKFPITKPEKPTLDSTYYQRDTNELIVKGLKDERVSLIDTKKQYIKEDNADYKLNKTIIMEYYRKEIPAKVGALETSIDLFAYKADGSVSEVPEIIIEEIETSEVFPLLNQVFFKKGNAELAMTSMHLLPKESTSLFKEEDLDWNTLKIYNDLLNIIGKRMLDNPKAKITITGCNSSLDLEKDNLKLSQSRADGIKDYLVNNWGISGKRIYTVSTGLPAKPANNLRPEGIEENQRAEITSTNPEILKPIVLKDIQRTSNPPIVNIIPKFKSEEGLKKWNMEIKQSDNTIRAYKGTNTIDTITWSIENSPMPELEEPVNISLTAVDNAEQTVQSSKDISIAQKTIKKKQVEMLGDKKIERYSLILFDYDKSEVTEKQNDFIMDISEKIKPNSKVIISGYTDRTGDKIYNNRLALDRANQVKKALGLDDSQVEINAIGSSKLIYDNDLPEGRSYSRTVKIIIETPIK